MGTRPTGTTGSFNLLVHLSLSIPNGRHSLTVTDSKSNSATTTFITPAISWESDSGIKPKPPFQPPSTPALSPLALLLLATTLLAVSEVFRRTKRPGYEPKLSNVI